VLTDDEGAFFLAIQLLNFAPNPFLGDDADADADDDLLLPNNAPVCGEATFFFLVNQRRNFAPNPFLGDAGGLEADDTVEPVTDDLDADVLDADVPDADDLDADVLDADVPDADDDLLPNNTPVCGEATFFFLVNQPRNFAPNPFLGDAGGLEADDTVEPVTDDLDADVLDADVPDADDDLLPNNTPVCGEATFFFLVNQPRNFAPNPFLGDAGGLEADDAEPVTNGPGADFLDDDDDLLPNNASELPDNEDAFFLVVRVNTFLTPAAAAGDGDGSLAPFALASAIAFALAFAFFASLHETNLSLPFTSKLLAPLLIYLVPLVRAYNAGAPFLSFSSSAELVRECLLLLGFL
jgi:hypothetical protein